MENTDKTEFRLVSINGNQCVDNLKDAESLNLDSEGLKLNYKVEVVVNIPENAVYIAPVIRYASGEKSLFEACAVFNFQCANIQTLVTVNKNDQTISVTEPEVLPSLVRTAFDSMRGIIFQQTKGSAVDKYPVPLVDGKTLMEKCEISVIEPASGRS